MKLFRYIIVIFILTIGISPILPSPVYAIADPDTPPSVNAVYVYNMADGGTGVLIDYYLDYAILPTETVTEAYLVVFVDTDGTTQLKAVAPYTYQDSGYGRGLIWIPFTSAEVALYSLDATDIALYRVWLVGNPALTWVGDPPKTVATIDQWNTVSDPATLIALRVLYYADQLELIWTPTVDLIEVTALGNRLTADGQSYFENVIPGLREIAPACLAATELEPDLEDLDYTTEFGAIVSGAVVALSPVNCVEGANVIGITGVGTVTLILTKGTVGTAVGAIVVGTPVDLVYGTNTVTTTGAGNMTVTVNVEDTASWLNAVVIGTGFDLTAIATIFGMSRWMFSGLIWIIITIIVCAAVYRTRSQSQFGDSGGNGKIILLVFDICIIGGALLGLLHPVVAILLFIGFGIFTGYIIHYRGASI